MKGLFSEDICKKNIRMIALDLDGTALNSQGVLSPATREALEQAAGAGIVVTAATGRAFGALPEELFAADAFTYAVTSNGTGIYRMKDRARIYSNLMSDRNLSDLLDVLLTYPCPMEAFINGTAYADSRYVKATLSFGVSERSAAYVRATRTPVDDIPALIRAHSGQVEGMDIIVTDPALKTQIRQKVSQIPDLYVTSSVAHYLEFAAGGATKESALAHLARELDIPREAVLAFGDGENDLEMLRFAGIGVAMGNACPLLKEAADFVTGTNDEDGIALAIQRLIQ